MRLSIFLYLLLSIGCLVPAAIAQNTEIEATKMVRSAAFLIHEKKQLDSAFSMNRKAFEFFELNHATRGLAYCAINQANYYAQLDSFELALKIVQEAAVKYQDIYNKDKYLGALFLESKAFCHWGIAAYTTAYQYALEAMSILKKMQDWQHYVSAALIASYCIYKDANRPFGQLESQIEHTYRIAKQYLPKNSYVLKYIYQLYGAVLLEEGRINKAIDVVHQGLHLQTKILALKAEKNDSLIVCNYLFQLGKMYAEKKDIEQSITYFNNAAIWMSGLKLYDKLLKLNTHLGDLYEDAGQLEAAKICFEKVAKLIPLLDKDPAQQHRSGIYEHLSVSRYHSFFKRYMVVVHYYKKQLPFILKHQLAVDKAYINLAKAYQKLGNFERSEYYFKKALAIEERKYAHKGTTVAHLYLSLANMYKDAKQHSQSIQYIDSVLSILNGNRPLVYNKRQLCALMDKPIAIRALQLKAAIRMQQYQYRLALDDYEALFVLSNYLINHFSGNTSKLSHIHFVREIYESAALAAWNVYQNGDKEAAERIFAYSENCKSTLLHENRLKFRNQYKKGGQGIPQELLDKEEYFIVKIQMLKEHLQEAKHAGSGSEVANIQKQILEFEQQLDALENKLRSNFEHYRSWDHGKAKVLHPEMVQKQLEADATMVEYFMTDSCFFIMYLTQDSFKVKKVTSFNAVEFKSRLRDFRLSFANINYILDFPQIARSKYHHYAQWLYTHYLSDELLKHKKHLIVVPDKKLNYIPFEILLTKAANDSLQVDFSNLDYLIRDYSIHYEYSAALMLDENKASVVENGKIMGFAPQYNQQIQYQSLNAAQKSVRSKQEIAIHNNATEIPGAFKEINVLAQHYQGDYFYGKEATEHRFKLMNSQYPYSVIHLAMHGVVDYKRPAYSYLLFTENLDSLEDNLLYSYESQHLIGQNTNLVVLSACKTGFGKYESGEGIMSLGRNFLHAGVPSVIMTLWELNDKASTELMRLFYHYLSEGMTKDKALQQAKLHYLKKAKGKAQHPFFWAAFVAIGDPCSIQLTTKGTGINWWIALFAGLFLTILANYFYRQKKSGPKPS